jgi:eukaryotic-like serine/threonine-protein kinase
VLAVIGGVAVVGAAVAAFLMLGQDHASCGSGDDRVAAVWTPTVRGDVQHAFSAANRPNAKASFDRLAHIVDEWNDTWKQGYVGACRATHGGEQSAHVLDLRMQCLAQKLEAERVTLALLANGGGDAIDHALDAVAGLPSVNSCADAAALTAAVAPPGTLATQGAVIGAREQLRAAYALRLIGRYRASLATARSALVAARATGYLPVIAEAQLAIGSAQGELADPEAAATLADAMKTAATAGDVALMLEAAAGRVYMLTLATHYDVAQELADLADAMASRAQLSVAVKVSMSSAVAYLLANSGKPEQAVARYQKTIAMAMREGAGPLAVANVSNLLAITYQDEGHYEDARKTYEQALAIDTQVFGADHPDIANVLNNIGNVYRVEGKLDDAKKAYDRALAIRIAAFGPDHPSVGTSYNSLGNYYGTIGDLPTAMQYYDKEIALIEKRVGPNSFELVASLSNLADLERQKGDLVAARAGYGRARAIVEAIGPDRPEDATILNGLGVVAESEGKYAEALDLYLTAEQVIVKTYGPDHPDAVDELLNLVNTYRHLHRYSDAEALATRAQAAVMKAYGEDAPHMGGLLVNWGDVETDQKHFAAAIEHHEKALALFEAKLPKGHPYTAYALVGIGDALRGEKQNREALEYYERALPIETAAGADPLGIAEVQFDIALAAIADPTSKAHAIALAKSALEGYKRADNTDKMTEISAWLRKHR